MPGALSPHAISGIGTHQIPDITSRGKIKIGAGAIGGEIDPPGQRTHFFLRFWIRKKSVHPLLGAFHPTTRNVVVAPLHQHRTEFIRDHRSNQRYVFVVELFLKCDGVGDHHHPLIMFQDTANRRQKVAKGLACPCARLDQQRSTGA